MTTLLDTNILIDLLRKRPVAVAWFANVESSPAVSVVSAMELFRGARSRREETQIELLLASASLLPVTIETAETAGRLAKHFKASHGLDDLDALIAATAEQHGLKLATLNTKHFPMFPKLKRAY